MTVSTTAAVSQQTLAAAASSTSTSGADFNMFLKLLTTQMQNQDPLDPMKTSEYTQQLAQYSQIEQTVQQSGTLKEILARLSTQDLAQASGMIGKQAVFDSAASGLGTAPAGWAYTPAPAATSMVATITDATGNIVATRTIAPADATGRFTWDGTRDDGSVAKPGSYTLALAATNASGSAFAIAANGTGTISGVSQAGGVLAVAVNGIIMPLSSLTSVSTPGA
jgi:flagellar basal-body rod modification protein FlgD